MAILKMSATEPGIVILLLALAGLPFGAGVTVGGWADSPLPGPGEKPTVPEAFGVNIHFNSRPPTGEMEMLAASGVKWIRMDFSWADTETTKGQYNFTDYDLLTASLRAHDLGAIYILDYANSLYDGGLSPHTDEGRAAFAAWSTAGATHFKSDKILWEMYNEPNIGFWKPKPNVQDYVKLALAVGESLREHAPFATYVGPATSRVDYEFLENCFGAGLLELWSAVTVHPYRDTVPEWATPDYTNLRALIDKYAPKGKAVPIVSSEWGYSSRYRGFDVERQAKSLPRMWLNNLMNGVVLSIYYDWLNDGTNQTYTEHHFGMVYNKYHAGRTPVHDPKPAYKAAQTLNALLNGMQFKERLPVDSSIGNKSELYAAVFETAATAFKVPAAAGPSRLPVSTGPSSVLVAWCSNHTLIPCSMHVRFGSALACYDIIDYTGQPLPQLCADDGGGLTFVADNAPLYFVPSA